VKSDIGSFANNFTSTGGIIALGFGVKGWSIEQCSDAFTTLCHKAFSPRKLQGVPFLKHLVTLRHASKFETRPLRDVLKESFGHQPLFGSDGKETSAPAAKVAVTATDVSGKKAIVIANYSRKDDTRKSHRKLHYDFPRPDRPDLELKIWEAAAATSAAPTFFKPFIHEPTERTYLDGAVYHNNPVRLVRSEAQLLWPDVADEHPDILLSIGTGQNRREMKNQRHLYGYEQSRGSSR
jgi:patatin-like phospholipase/acyl hydrolase